MKRLRPSFIRLAGGAEAPPAVLLTFVLRLFVFQLHEVYSRLCAQRQVSAVGQGECLSLCSLLESRGIIALKKAKEARLTKVRTSHLSPAASVTSLRHCQELLVCLCCQTVCLKSDDSQAFYNKREKRDLK